MKWTKLMTLSWILGNLRVVGQSDFRHRSSKSFMHISHKFMHEYLPTDPKIHFPKMVSSLAVTCVICGEAHENKLGRVAAGGWRSAAGRQSEPKDFSLAMEFATGANPSPGTFRPIRGHGLFAGDGICDGRQSELTDFSANPSSRTFGGYLSVRMSPTIITKCGQMLYHISAPLLDEYG